MGTDLREIAEDNFYLSKKYEDKLGDNIKKEKGIYYTPKVIVDYINNKTLKQHDIVKNPYPKVLDISCGCGNFLLEAYDILYDMFDENIYELSQKYKDKNFKRDNIHNHIISNCIYGADIDEEAINILKECLINKDKDIKVDKLNIHCMDSLVYQWEEKFDYIIGNPPYIGHKKLDKEYKQYILKHYSNVYKDKADLYFCFYEKISHILKDDGVASVITPRYFLESPSGKLLRNYLTGNVKIEEIVDFLGAPIFKNVGVASCIITFNKKEEDYKFINVYKIKDENLTIGKEEDLTYLLKGDKFEYFLLNQKSLGEEWIIVNKKDEEFYNKIQHKCDYTLGEVVSSFQGIITGCDKAFILEEDDERIKNIPKKLIKPWVKNKNINKYIVNNSNYKLIYADDIESEEKHKTVIRECMEKYKYKLENRRECKNNTRKWYHLQWGREKRLFERVKIMYPYKSKENRFAIDYSNNYSSADVYSFFIKENYIEEFSNEYLVGLLNSRVYDKYFKISAKKMSKEIYDYYPNKVMKMKIFKNENYEEIEKLSKEIIKILRNKNPEKINYKKVEDLQYEINKIIERYLEVESLI